MKPNKPLDWTKSLVTNDGRKARLVAKDVKVAGNGRNNHLVLVEGNGDPKNGSQKGVEQPLFYNDQGCYPGVGLDHPYSLKNDAKKTWRWLVLKENMTDTAISDTNLSEDEAKELYGARLLMSLPATLKEEDA